MGISTFITSGSDFQQQARPDSFALVMKRSDGLYSNVYARGDYFPQAEQLVRLLPRNNSASGDWPYVSQIQLFAELETAGLLGSLG
jgi:hypothetical protein